MKLAHVGLAVKNLGEAKKLWNSLGFLVEKEFEKSEPRAKVAVLRDGSGGRLELWEFDQSSDPLIKVIGKHAAFLCEDARADAANLIANGFKEVVPFTEGVTLDYIFLQDELGAFYELAQPKK